jgi:hypothetical protein
MLDAERRQTPAIARNRRRKRDEVETLAGELLSRLEVKQPPSPVWVRGEVLEILYHAIHAYEIRIAGICRETQELDQSRSLLRGESFVGVEGQDPSRSEFCGGCEQTRPVGGVIPSRIPLSHGVDHKALDERMTLEDLPRGVSASVVQRDHHVGEALH